MTNIKYPLNSCPDTTELSIYDEFMVLACTLRGRRVHSGVPSVPLPQYAINQ